MILVIDDDAVVRSSLAFLLKHAGYTSETVPSPKEALQFVRQAEPELILMDMNFTLTTTGEEGIQLLRQVKVLCPEVPVILMTAWGSISLAVQGMKAGAFDFITKPWNNLSLLNSIKTALDLNRQKKDLNEPLSRIEADKKNYFGNIIGRSNGLMSVLGMVSRIAPTNASVLITGESGTGKELIAEALHANSQRNQEAFVKVNLGGLSQSLFESEMFGHRKGAFTDAHMDRVGRFELANKGTIFLDEIGELELSSQVKLLRVLQDQTFEALGDSKTRKVDVRVVSATNRNLQEMVVERSFREDLYYRINLITIHLPPLRERREDIPLLARHFADKQAKINGLTEIEFSSEAVAYLQRLPFYGNVRELKNLVERTVLLSGKSQLDAIDFEKETSSLIEQNAPSLSLEGLTLDELERQRIIQALDATDGNLSHTAASLGISRAALYRRLEKYNIDADVKRGR